MGVLTTVQNVDKPGQMPAIALDLLDEQAVAVAVRGHAVDVIDDELGPVPEARAGVAG